ncbi:MAG: T9SS type A sorting domain-containing protein [Bacteroidota bacterium]
MRNIFTLLLLITIVQISSAQKQANRWYFGMLAGLDFNSGAPVPVYDGMLYTAEGSSSIADSAGNLLFYTDGITVFNRIHDTMPNGFDLMGDISSTQSALIVQKPGSTTLYYIFTTDADGGSDGFRYSVVDLTLDGGNGDVSVKNSLIKISPTEKISGVGNNDGTGVWVMTHDWGTDGFYAYFLSDTGLNMTPVISNTGTVHSLSNFQNTYGQMKFSPSGEKLALGIGYQGLLEIFDFDNSTGIVTHPISVSMGYSLRGVEFSPDNSKLYTTRFDNLNDIYFLDQFDLMAGSDSLIIASQFLLSNADVQAQLQLGPDGKIYMAKFNLPFLSVIANPNALGMASDFQDNALSLDTTFSGLIASQLGLPGFVQSYFKSPPVAAFTSGDTMICPGGCINFASLSLNQPTEWHWRFPGANPDTSSLENPQNICYPQSGFYPVTLITGNAVGYDTVTVNTYVTVRILPPVSISVNGDTIIVYNAVSQQWYNNGNIINGATGSQYIADGPGSYTVQITDSFGCEATSTPIVITGIDNVFGSQLLKTYPTPAENFLQVAIPDNGGTATNMSIHNVLGEEIMQLKPTGKNSKIDVRDLQAGYYLLRVNTTKGILTARFIKK